jgi:hypothetical protein
LMDGLEDESQKAADQYACKTEHDGHECKGDRLNEGRSCPCPSYQTEGKGVKKDDKKTKKMALVNSEKERSLRALNRPWKGWQTERHSENADSWHGPWP